MQLQAGEIEGEVRLGGVVRGLMEGKKGVCVCVIVCVSVQCFMSLQCVLFTLGSS